MDWIPIKSYQSRPSAEIGKALLEANGFEVKILADDVGGMRPHLGAVLGVLILVPEAQAAEAKALLETPVPEGDLG
jgi:hypothetical protein